MHTDATQQTIGSLTASSPRFGGVQLFDPYDLHL